MCRDCCVVLFASFFLYSIALGIPQSFGLLYSQLIQTFNVDQAYTAWIPSLYVGLLLGGGLLVGTLNSWLGSWIAITSGSLLMTVGMAGSAYVTSPYLLYLTYGVMAGTGACQVFVAANVIVVQTFNRRRSLAMAAASSGAGVGTVAIPPLVVLSIEQYTWKGTFLLLAGLCLQGVVVGSLVRVVDLPSQTDDSSSDEGKERSSAKSDACLEKFRNFFSFLSWPLLFITFSSFLTSMMYFVPFTMLPDMMLRKGLSPADGAWVMSSMGISNIVGRLLLGLVTNSRAGSELYIHILALLLAGGATVGSVYLTQFYQYVIYGTLLNIGLGTFGFLQPVLATQMAGIGQVDTAFGFLIMAGGIGAVIGVPLAGLITDYYGDYDAAFLVTGGVLLAAAISSIPATCRSSHEARTGSYQMGSQETAMTVSSIT